VDPNSNACMFLASARNCNPAIALQLMMNNRGRTLSSLIGGLTADVIKSTIPGIGEVQANKIVLFFKRSWRPLVQE